MGSTTPGNGPRDGWAEHGGQYEYRVLTLPRSTSRSDARRLLTEEAEYGRWELARTLLFEGGVRKVWLRRRIIRVSSTLGTGTGAGFRAG